MSVIFLYAEGLILRKVNLDHATPDSITHTGYHTPEI